MKPSKFAVSAAALVLVAGAIAGCGQKKETSATEKWAQDVCTAGSSLKSATTDLVTTVAKPTLSDIAGYKQKVTDKFDSLQTAITVVDQQWAAGVTLNGDTSSAQQQLRKDQQALYDAWAVVETAAGKLSSAQTASAAVAATAELADALKQVTGAAARLAEAYKVFTTSKNEALKSAFTNAQACKDLFGKK
ncbi:MAG: hypothetical protein RL745_339 [Actinomycetota bacterium]|jgi:hypothetical protein